MSQMNRHQRRAARSKRGNTIEYFGVPLPGDLKGEPKVGLIHRVTEDLLHAAESSGIAPDVFVSALISAAITVVIYHMGPEDAKEMLRDAAEAVDQMAEAMMAARLAAATEGQRPN